MRLWWFSAGALCACSPPRSSGSPDASATSATQGPSCAIDGSAPLCLSGTASASAFSATATSTLAFLYRVAPIDGANSVAIQQVGSDGTWAFDTTSVGADGGWSHYYVQIATAFGEHTVSGTVGPLTVPASGPTAFDLEPVRGAVFESEGQFESATVYLFDPASGAEIMDDAGVLAIAVGDASLPLTWNGRQMAYATAGPASSPDAQTSSSLDAQAAYTLTIVHPALGPRPTTWRVAAHETKFTGQVLSPALDASVSAGDLVVQWQPDPNADYVQLNVFGPENEGPPSSWPVVYQSPTPNESDVTEETVPRGTFQASGTYLVDVVYAQANCPAGAAGCVYSATAAATAVQVTVSDASTN